ncbi:diphthine methyl ester synthase-like [Convolutriloba macropyga]|uniref:diphthine methyl ester synthase-like n=1 Tax=Convolutriloba macropyga TaxID=536237 RepID=UPI003F51B925
MLFIVGLGLGSPDDITLRGLNALKTCSRIFLETYTSLMTELDLDDGTSGKLHLAKTLNLDESSIVLADRTMMEQTCERDILSHAFENNIAILVVGDPFAATTHHDMILRAREKGIKVEVIHNASILTAVGATGLQLYRFGETVSLCFWTDTWKPTSAFEKVMKNFEAGLHTLCLLDIKVKEQTVENMMRGNKIFEPPRFMTAHEAASQICESIEILNESEENACDLTPSSICVAVARLGSKDQIIKCCSLADMCNADVGRPLHSLIIPANLHELEQEYLYFFKAQIK